MKEHEERKNGEDEVAQVLREGRRHRLTAPSEKKGPEWGRVSLGTDRR